MGPIFRATLTPMLTLFLCMAIGFALNKSKILPNGAGKVMAKLLTWVFFPALNFSTMSTYCTPATLRMHGTNVIFGSLTVAIAVGIAIPLSRVFVRSRSPERGVYQYALAFGNQGYVGDPLIQALFGDEMLSYYKLFCLPSSLVIYTWGIAVLVPGASSNKKALLKKVINAPTIATLSGVIVGLSGLGPHLPTFLTGTLGNLKACMGPTAMLLAGYTVATYSIVNMLKKGKVYVATALRLLVLPSVLIAALFGARCLAELLGVHVSNLPLFLAFFAFAAPLGLNTVVFPEAYGGDPEPGAAMAMISHTLCVLTIPLLYALMTLIFGAPTL